MIEWLRHLWQTPQYLWSAGDEILFWFLCIGIWILGFPVFLLIQYLRGEYKVK